MPERCVVYGCSNTASKDNGIFLYQIPFWDKNTSEPVKRRKNGSTWFGDGERNGRQRVRLLCVQHIFTEECFEYGSATVEKYKIPRLKRDEFGVCVCPNLQTNQVVVHTESERTKRIKRRKVSCS